MNERRAFERFDLSLPANIKPVSPVEKERPELLHLLTRDICAGGAFFHTSLPLPERTKVQISLTFGLEKLRKLTGTHAFIKATGTVVRSEPTGMAVAFDEDYRIIPLNKVRKRSVHWNASLSPSVVGYRVYWAVGGGVSFNSHFSDVGNVTQVVLPDDIPSFPLVSEEVELGVTAINHMGMESEMSKCSAHFDFAPPEAPTGLSIEEIEPLPSRKGTD